MRVTTQREGPRSGSGREPHRFGLFGGEDLRDGVEINHKTFCEKPPHVVG